MNNEFDIVKYIEILEKSIDALCNEIVKYIPDILDIKYDQNNMNDWDNNKSVFRQRMLMGLQFELMRAGIKANLDSINE